MDQYNGKGVYTCISIEDWQKDAQDRGKNKDCYNCAKNTNYKYLKKPKHEEV